MLQITGNQCCVITADIYMTIILNFCDTEDFRKIKVTSRNFEHSILVKFKKLEVLEDTSQFLLKKSVHAI